MSSIDYKLLLGREEIIAPKEFTLSCGTFSSMFEDTGDTDNSIPIPITDLYSVDEIKNYIKLFMDLNKLEVKNNNNVTMSYLDYLVNYREEFKKNYCYKIEIPPHCDQLIKIYSKISLEGISKIGQIDRFFNNNRIRKGTFLLLLAVIRKGNDEEIDKVLGYI